MNEDGEFLCAEHKPPPQPYQWVVAVEIECKCDRCEKQAEHYVLQKQ